MTNPTAVQIFPSFAELRAGVRRPEPQSVDAIAGPFAWTQLGTTEGRNSIVIIDAQDDMVAMIPPGPRQQANLRAIERLPDLLEVLRGMVAHWDCVCDRVGSIDDFQYLLAEEEIDAYARAVALLEALEEPQS